MWVELSKDCIKCSTTTPANTHCRLMVVASWGATSHLQDGLQKDLEVWKGVELSVGAWLVLPSCFLVSWNVVGELSKAAAVSVSRSVLMLALPSVSCIS